MSSDRSFGNVRNTPASVLATRLAEAILEFASPRAVTVDPQGRVHLERPDDAAECDLVGVYTRSLGRLGLSQLIRDDLLLVRESIAPRPPRHTAAPARRVA